MRMSRLAITHRQRIRFLLIAVALCLPLPLDAKIAPSVRERIAARFPPAVPHRGLLNAQDPLEPGKLRGFVVLLKDGLPAEKAFWFITNQDYEYRPVVIDGETIATRRGPTYTYLRMGQVMAIAALEFSGNTVYLKLLSPEIVAHAGSKENHPSRVAVMLGFRLSKHVAAEDPAGALAAIETWLKPFPDQPSAAAHAARLISPK